MRQPREGPALTLLHLGRQQRLEVADVGLPLPHRGLGQAGELTADSRHAQRLTLLPDGLLLDVAHHAVPRMGRIAARKLPDCNAADLSASAQGLTSGRCAATIWMVDALPRLKCSPGLTCCLT